MTARVGSDGIMVCRSPQTATSTRVASVLPSLTALLNELLPQYQKESIPSLPYLLKRCRQHERTVLNLGRPLPQLCSAERPPSRRPVALRPLLQTYSSQNRR